MFKRFVSVMVCIAPVVGCGGGGDGGTTPPPPPAVLGSITPSVSTLSLGAGQSQDITMSARDANGQSMTVSGYTFTSSAPSVAVVSSGGRVTGLTAGTATVNIAVTHNGVSKSASVAVTVTGALPNTVTVAAGANSDDFTPQFVAIARGGTVTWTFGARVHNVDFQNGAGAPANVPNSANTSVSRTFANAGSFNYLCTLHANQNGSVLVP